MVAYWRFSLAITLGMLAVWTIRHPPLAPELWYSLDQRLPYQGTRVVGRHRYEMGRNLVPLTSIDTGLGIFLTPAYSKCLAGLCGCIPWKSFLISGKLLRGSSRNAVSLL
ncbi:hypothetical protein F4820DRAFT_188918 [Hypoxylon rubiginosum]|uniref:Uncharacterized protein n=1 Tax=Hypoxylon rubiginosum TaxID=110542 RepID=A0ACB9YI40_9PEZI|nr:hypothetical protein F4820DRAFT_188918 [Hypoxylon rubiginosum]